MTDQFASDPTDFTNLYTEAPKDPAQDLFTELQQSLKPAELSGIAQGGEAPKAPGVKGPAKSTKAQGAGTSTALARIKPLGIANVAQLRGKTDAELRQLSSDAIAYELRQNSLSRFFGKNADGTWNYMVGPDGRPTGLDANGQVLPPQPPAPPPAPVAPAPAAPAPAPVAAPRAPAPQAAPTARAATSVKAAVPAVKAAVTKVTQAVAKSAPKKPAPKKPAAPRVSTPVTATNRARAV